MSYVKGPSLEAVVVHGEECVARDGVVHEDGDVALHPLRQQPLTNLEIKFQKIKEISELEGTTVSFTTLSQR